MPHTKSKTNQQISDNITKNLNSLTFKTEINRQVSSGSRSSNSGNTSQNQSHPAIINSVSYKSQMLYNNEGTTQHNNGKISPSSYDSGMIMAGSSGCNSNANSTDVCATPNSVGTIEEDEKVAAGHPIGSDPTGRIAEFLDSSNKANKHRDSTNHYGLSRTGSHGSNGLPGLHSNSRSQNRARRHSGNQHYYSLSHANDSIPENFMSHGPAHMGEKIRNERKNDKKSRSGVSLGICKNGGGGKFTWGKPGIEYTSTCPSGENDFNDPNYDEFEEDENTIYEIRDEPNCSTFTDEDIREQLLGPFKEYLINADDSEMFQIFKMMDTNYNTASRVFFHLLLWSLESSKKYRGHVWVLIQKMLSMNKDYSYFGDTKCIFKALEDFFDARVELVIDHPEYDDFIQKILGCLLYEMGDGERKPEIDEFLGEEMRLRAKTFTKVVSVSYSIVKRIKSSSAIMSIIWVMDDYLTPEQLSYELSKIVEDWKHDGFSSRSLADDIRTGVNAPHYYHELVYQLLIKSLNIGSAEALEAVVSTIAYLVKQEIVEKNQVKQGFLRIYGDFDELKIDIPKCTALIAKIVNSAVESKIIDDEVRVKMPRMRGDRRRAFSEMT